MARTIFVTGITIWMSMVTISISMPVPGIGFHGYCDGSTILCDTTKSLECVTTGTEKLCKCMSGLYHYYGTCTNNAIANLQVLNQTVYTSTFTPTELLVAWDFPPHARSIDRIEVSTTPVTQTVTLNTPLTNQARLTGLQDETTYTIKIKSVDTISTVTEQSTFVTINGTTAPFKNVWERCSSDDCNPRKNLQCARGVCRCLTDYYGYEGTCYQTYDKILVRNATALPTNTTSLQVTWNLPEHATPVDKLQF